MFENLPFPNKSRLLQEKQGILLFELSTFAGNFLLRFLTGDKTQ